MTTQWLLDWHSRTGVVRRALKQATRAGAAQVEMKEPLLPGNLRVAAVQMQMALLETPAFVQRVAGHVRRAAASGAHLVVFPEHTGSMLLGLLPAVRNGARSATLLPGHKPQDVMGWVAPAASRVMHEAFGALAQQYNCYIVSGTLVLDDAGAYRARNALFAPQGGVAGAQDKLHPSFNEMEWLKAGDALNVHPIDQLGADCATVIALLASADAGFWEPARIACNNGAEVLVESAADDDPLTNPYAQARGLLMRTQEVPCFGVRACMVGDFMNMKLRGPSYICAPWPITAQKDGSIAVAASDSQAELLMADLDLEALRTLRAERTV
jgi:predicted amidohydrolase